MNDFHSPNDEEIDALSGSIPDGADNNEHEPDKEHAITGNESDVNPQEQDSDTQHSMALTVLSIDEIVPNPNQPRKIFDQESLNDLAESIRRHGILQPITVRAADGTYQIIMGERRGRAAKLAGLKRVTVLVEMVDEAESILQTVTENEMRKDLTRIEKADGIAYAYQIVKVREGKDVTVEAFAQRLGMKETYVYDKMAVSRMPEFLREIVRRRPDCERQALILFRAKKLTEEQKQELAGRIIASRLTVKQVESELIKARTSDSGSNAIIATQWPTRNAPTSLARSEPNTITLSDYSLQRSDALHNRHEDEVSQASDSARAEFPAPVDGTENVGDSARAELVKIDHRADTEQDDPLATNNNPDVEADAQSEPEVVIQTLEQHALVEDVTADAVVHEDIREPDSEIMRLARELEVALNSDYIWTPLTLGGKIELADQLRRTAERATDHADTLG